MVNMKNLMQQAQAMQQKVQEAQSKLESKEYTGTSGGEMVTASMNGRGEVISLKIDDSLIDKSEKDMLEDLILAALKNAKKQKDQDSQDSMSGIMPPGMKMPF